MSVSTHWLNQTETHVSGVKEIHLSAKDPITPIIVQKDSITPVIV
jgi:hypothetical protein